MKSFQIVALVGALFGFAHAQNYPEGALGSSYRSPSVSTTPRPLPPAQVHYVNIGEDLTGDYKFGYDTGKNDGGQSFREESRLPDGTVKGAYGYIDAEGKQRIVKYTAGIEGFKVESDEAAPGQGAPAQPAPQRSYQPRPAPVQAAPQQSYQLPPQSQPLGGYTPAAPSRYSPPAPVQSAPAYQPPTTYTPRSQSQTSQASYNAALQAQLAAAQAQANAQALQQQQAQAQAQAQAQQQAQQQAQAQAEAQARAQQAAAQPQYRPQSVPSYSATLAQRQPTLAAQGRPSHLGSIPRSSPSLASYGASNFASSAAADQESTTWGPPVINKELLSYNIGVGR